MVYSTEALSSVTLVNLPQLQCIVASIIREMYLAFALPDDEI